MRVRLDRLSATGVAAAVVAFAAGAVAWPRLPAEMVVHFSAAGRPGTTVPRTVGIVILPAAMLVTAVVLRATFRVDPPDSERSALVVTAAVHAFLLALQLLLVARNLGYRVPFDYVFVGTLAWGALVLGYAVVVEHRGG